MRYEIDEQRPLETGQVHVKRFTVVRVESEGIARWFCCLGLSHGPNQVVGFQCVEGTYVWLLVIGDTIHCPACLAPYKTLDEAEG